MPDLGTILVYRPGHPLANENGMVPKHLAPPKIVAEKARHNVMSDIEPYRSVATDRDGERAVIGGRRQHREFLSRNGYTEVGNEFVSPHREELTTRDRVADIKHAIERSGV